MIRVVLLTCAWASIAAVAHAETHPLLTFARERQARSAERPPMPVRVSGVPAALHAIEQSHPPASADCARSLGAQRFAELYGSLGAARSAVGDFQGAAEAYRHAVACRPRVAELHAALGSALFDARDYVGARDAVQTALALDPRSVTSMRLAANLDFIEEHWADAVARFRYVASSDPDRQTAAYGQLMYWLAQARAGVAQPEFVARTPGDGWPQPLLLYLRDEYAETELLQPIREGDDADNSQPNTSTDERLCEALFYVGEAYWARGEPAIAREHFTALVNMRVIYFLEHGLALAEIAKLRD